MKRWLVTSHDQYYPCGGDSDWVEAFEDEERYLADRLAAELDRKWGNNGRAEVIDMWRWMK